MAIIFSSTFVANRKGPKDWAPSGSNLVSATPFHTALSVSCTRNHVPEAVKAHVARAVLQLSSGLRTS